LSLNFRNGVKSVANIVFVQIAEEIAASAGCGKPLIDKTRNGNVNQLKALETSDLIAAFEDAEKKYPNDYRFPCEQ